MANVSHCMRCPPNSRENSDHFSTQRNLKESPLLRLPPELLLLILSQVFTGVYEQDTYTTFFAPRTAGHPEILSVCRYIYAEARFLPFTDGTFLFKGYHLESSVKSVLSHPNTCSCLRVGDLLRGKCLKSKLSTPLFKYAAQLEKMETIQFRTDLMPLLPMLKMEILYIPGLKRIVLYECCVAPNYIIMRSGRGYPNYRTVSGGGRDQQLEWYRELVSNVQQFLGSSVQVEFGARDLLGPQDDGFSCGECYWE